MDPFTQTAVGVVYQQDGKWFRTVRVDAHNIAAVELSEPDAVSLLQTQREDALRHAAALDTLAQAGAESQAAAAKKPSPKTGKTAEL